MKKIFDALISSKLMTRISDVLNLKISNSFNKKVEIHFYGPVTLIENNSKLLKNKTESP